MNIIYEIVYLPFENTEYPSRYIGSKYRYKESRPYYGSVASSQVFDYTDGLALKDWWKYQVKHHPDRFEFRIIESVGDVNPIQLVDIEKGYHEEMGVLGPKYFNQSIATTGFASGKKSDQTRNKIQESTKLYWETQAGKEKRARLSERNRRTKTGQARSWWYGLSEEEQTIRRQQQSQLAKRPRRKGIERKRYERPVVVKGKPYDSASEASIDLDVSVVTIRRWCKTRDDCSVGESVYDFAHKTCAQLHADLSIQDIRQLISDQLVERGETRSDASRVAANLTRHYQ